ncbi:hypothetical protein NQ317_016949 [Molorchus minor]|uniref:ABC transmembrane type-1 domain-containing protein n=1 Tax=Molorchus minor TaxID=1323400 RepID=A0ABQ9K340_9CUCU|nr:hypothetical protein NQ317_016949 [Molorchus minor]
MAPNYSKFLTRNNALAGAGFNAERKKIRTDVEEEVKYLIAEKPETKTKAQVDKLFLVHLGQLFKIVVPGWSSKECGLFFLIAVSLISRSLCDLWLIDNGTKIESAIISMDKPLFKKRLINFFLAMPVIAIVNNVLKYSIGALKINLRTNLTKRLYEDYLKNYTYYRMTNLDNRISNADQLLTTDIDKFCEGLADLYCNTAKPMLDIGIYVYKLTSTLGGSTPGYMLAYLVVSGVILTHIRKPTARLTAGEQKLEGEFRHINARLITHSEEIAFYNGNMREKNDAFSQL